jgi:ADP-ribose pyrophosphatase YjhB (NUDIX family)
VLFILRKYPPRANYWCVPGGKVEFLESLESSAVREAREETGLAVSPLAWRLADAPAAFAATDALNEGQHYVVAHVACATAAASAAGFRGFPESLPAAVAGDDAAAAVWVHVRGAGEAVEAACAPPELAARFAADAAHLLLPNSIGVARLAQSLLLAGLWRCDVAR